jgi:hypothetical protein
MMMPIPNLADFSSKELDFLLTCVAKTHGEAQYMVNQHEGMGTEPPKKWRDECDLAQLWATQIIAAKARVIRQEKIMSN